MHLKAIFANNGWKNAAEQWWGVRAQLKLSNPVAAEQLMSQGTFLLFITGERASRTTRPLSKVHMKAVRAYCALVEGTGGNTTAV
jgi:hypothetical protein